MKSIREIRDALRRMHHYATGQSQEAYMSVPARPEHDADLILSAALDELALLREANAELVAALGQLRLEVTHYRETGHGMDHLITAEGEAIRVLLEHHSRAALSKAGSK